MTTEEEAGWRPSGSTALGIPIVDSGDHWSGVVGNAALFSRAFRIYYAWGIGEHWDWSAYWNLCKASWTLKTVGLR
jgi:hypothetical protein